MKNIIKYCLVIFIIIASVYANNYDRNWMNYVDDNLKINQVIIPGTHDSGTCNVNIFEAEWTRTQSLNIKEQLENGIRYLDIRLTIDEEEPNNIYLSHDEYCVEFLSTEISRRETIILHIKKEKVPSSYTNSKIAKILYNILFGGKYKNFIYDDYSKIPTLGQLRRYKMPIPSMGACYEYSNHGILRFNDGTKCYPVISLSNDKPNNLEYRVQDNYHLEKDDKWDMIYDVLMNKINSRDSDKYNDSVKIISDNNKFYDKIRNDTLTINFFNIARASDELGWISSVLDTIFDSSIKTSASEINNNFVNFNGREICNQWIIMDFPSNPAIRKAYTSNSYISTKDVTIKGLGYYVDAAYNIIKKIFNPLGKRDENNTQICLQRELAYNENGEKYYAVTSDSKCIDNSKSKWYIKSNGKYFNIISDYDQQCLVVFDNKYLGLYSCGKKNDSVNELFSIVNNKICSSTNNNLCINNDFDITPAILESEEYKKLTCSIDIIKQGYKCCSRCIDINSKDEYGNWGVENGDWCGIPFECTATDLRTIPQNPKNYKFRIRNVETNKCLITYNTGNSDRILLGDCDDTNYSGWYVKYNKLISSYNNKCLYVTNGIDAAMENCDKIYNGDDRYKYFDIIDNKYICVKYNLDSQKCLNGENLRFLTLKNKYSEWEIENLDGITITPIDNIEIDIPEPTSKCYSKAGYPCCSPEITEVKYTDDEGNWGYENNDWCLITNSATTISTTTTTVEPTSTPTNSEPSVTVKPGYAVYWFYHAFTNKCLYAPKEPNKPITVKPCDESNYSKWMVLTSRKGYFYSMAHPDYCLRVADVDTGSLELGKCDEQAKMVHDNDGFLTLIESSDKCVGFLNDKDMYNNEIEMNLNTC
ncbi:Non-catalytic module family DOC2, partial [Piromyces sp. E2]